MKALKLDYDFYCYPKGMTCAEDFVAYATEHYNSFIKLERFDTENCVNPYFIEEDREIVYLNIARIEQVQEVEITVLPRIEYEARLAAVVEEKCVNCIHYEDDSYGDNMKGHRDKLSLDGECWGFERKE